MQIAQIANNNKLPYSEFDYKMREKEDVYTAMAGDGGYDCGRFPGDAAQLACFDFKHCLAYIQPGTVIDPRITHILFVIRLSSLRTVDSRPDCVLGSWF